MGSLCKGKTKGTGKTCTYFQIDRETTSLIIQKQPSVCRSDCLVSSVLMENGRRLGEQKYVLPHCPCKPRNQMKILLLCLQGLTKQKKGNRDTTGKVL